MIEYKVEVDTDGTKAWFLNDKLHREDGPAIEYAEGTKCWYLNGNLHREDGPAIEYASGDKRWFLNGKELTKQEHKKATSKPTCSGKEVTIDGVTYVLKEKNAAFQVARFYSALLTQRAKLTAALDGIANTPDEIAVELVLFLHDEYDRQIDAAFEELRRSGFEQNV